MSILMYLTYFRTFCLKNQEYSVVRKFTVFSVNSLIFKSRNKPEYSPFLLWAVLSVEVPPWGTSTLFRKRQSWGTINNTQSGRWWIEEVDVTRQVMMCEISFKICEYMHHHTIQINQPTRCNNSWRLCTAQHVSGVLTFIIRSSTTAVEASGFTVGTWW